MQRLRLARFQGDGFHWVNHRCLVRFWRLVQHLDIRRAAQTFCIGHGQAESQRLVSSYRRGAKGRFRRGAVGDSHRCACGLGPLVGQRIAIRVGRGRAIQRHGNRAGDGLIHCGCHWGTVADNRLVRGRTAAQQAFVHGIQDVAVIRLNGPREQAAKVFVEDILAFRSNRTGVVIAQQFAGGFVKEVRCFSRGVIFVLPAWLAFHLVSDDAIVNDTRFPGTCNWPGRCAGERIVTVITMHTRPAAAIHRRTDHDFARLYVLIQHRFHRVVGGVVGGRIPGGAIQRRLVTQLGVAPCAVVVVAHQEDMVDILLSVGVIHVLDLIFTRANRGGQLISAAGFR